MAHEPKGRVWLLPDDIDTGQILPHASLAALDPEETRHRLFGEVCPGLAERIEPGDILWAGDGFGQGSSREDAARCVQDLGVRLVHRGAAFVATNADAAFPTPEGPAPATGAIVAALRYASGREAEVIGKPSAAMFDAALDGAARAAAVMVGDTPATDIAGARRAGIAAVLVAADGAAPELEPDMRPERVVRGLAELLADV